MNCKICNKPNPNGYRFNGETTIRICATHIARRAASEEARYFAARGITDMKGAERIAPVAAASEWLDADDDLGTEERGYRASAAERQFYGDY